MAVDRLERVDALLKRVIGDAMFRIMQTDTVGAGLITVTGVQCARNLRNATVSIRELVPVAEDLGVNLALENVWNRFLISPMEWKLFLDQFASSRVGIYFDAANCCLNCRPQDFPEILGAYIKAVHLKNFEEFDSAGGLHGFGDDIFKGVVDFKALFAALAKIGYAGPLTVEMIPFSRLPDLVMPDAALAGKMAEQIAELKKLLK